ncbi:MAG: Hemoglobin-like protein [Myxococcales bacterium]|nr:Hemoglobin-like protein [Myxococcales bacterium]
MKTTGVLACLFIFGCGSSPKPPPAAPAPAPEVAAEPAPATTPPPAPAPAPPAPKSLYDRLGGLPAITAVVGEFVANVAGDARINQRFFNTDIENLKKLLTEFVCMATGGPCKYSGRDMGTAHAGMDLVDDEFNALVENLIKALDKFKVPEKEKGELLGALGPLKPAIVVSADKLKPIDAAKLAAVTKVASTVKDKGASDLLAMAVIAGQRGQRSYAEQLFSRAELITGPKPLASIASTFRAGAPPRITTALKKMAADTAAQPKTVGSSDADDPDKKPAAGQLHGALRVDGKAPNGIGVIQLWPDKGAKKRTAKARVIEQRGKTFMPHVMAVPVGSTISFPNFDPIYHNVFSLSKTKQFDLGLYKNGETREVKVDKAGIVRLGCNLHANMSAYLVVVDAPHYAVVDADGNFSFKSLAPGKYKVQAWIEPSVDPTTSEVTIKAGDNESNIDIKPSSGPAISPDKFGTARQ